MSLYSKLINPYINGKSNFSCSSIKPAELVVLLADTEANHAKLIL